MIVLAEKKKMNNSFVRFECGCVGIIIQTPSGQGVICLEYCEYSNKGVSFKRRDSLLQKEFVPLSEESVMQYTDAIDKGLWRGKTLQQIRSLFDMERKNY